MKYQSIDYVEKPVSRMIFGCAIPPMLEGKCVDTLLDAVYQTGINTFDTAQNYQKSEVFPRPMGRKTGVAGEGCTDQQMLPPIFRRVGSCPSGMYL